MRQIGARNHTSPLRRVHSRWKPWATAAVTTGDGLLSPSWNRTHWCATTPARPAVRRLEEGFVDAYTGDPALRRQVENEPRPDPRRLAVDARALRTELPGAGFTEERTRFLDAHLTALECSARKFAGTTSVSSTRSRPTSTSGSSPRTPDTYREAHRRMDAVLPGPGTLAQRMEAHRAADRIPPERLAECGRRVRQRPAGPGARRVHAARDRAWRRGRRRQAVVRVQLLPRRLPVHGRNHSDLDQHMSNLPRLIAHESYPGHHTEHCRKEAGLVGAGQLEQTLFVVNTRSASWPRGSPTWRWRPSWVRAGGLGAGDLRRPGAPVRRRAGRGAVRGVGRAAVGASGRRAPAPRSRAPTRTPSPRSCSAGRCRAPSGPSRACGSCRRRCGGPTSARTSRATGCSAPGWTARPSARSAPSGSDGCSTSPSHQARSVTSWWPPVEPLWGPNSLVLRLEGILPQSSLEIR